MTRVVRHEPVAPPFWTRPLADLLAELHAGPEGLSTEEARRRLEQFGPNALTRGREGALSMEAFRFLTNPLVLLLLAASGISAAVGERVDAGVIAGVVLLSMVLDFAQAYRSGRAAERLRQVTATTATVKRDGREVRVPLSEVVPGDVVLLSPGTLVPADSRLLEANDLSVSEAPLTGESAPVEKEARDLPPTATAVTDAANTVFSGTAVVTGTGRAVAVRTGPRTELGRIAGALAARAPETEFEHGARQFGAFILRTVFVLVLLVFLGAAVRRRDALESFLFAVALAVGMTPEFLPMIISVALGAGALRMARKRVLVRRLMAIENYGSMDVLCSDKTGTLTEGRMTLAHACDPNGNSSDRPLELALLTSAFTAGVKSPLDCAILESRHSVPAGYEMVDEVSFDFQRRRQSVVLRRSGEAMLLMATKGAPESVLAACSHYQANDHVAPIGADDRARLLAAANELNRQGYRTLAVASRTLGAQPRFQASDEHDLILAGFLAFLDPPRPDVGPVLRAMHEDGIQVKILTGDSDLVAQHVCRQVGLPVEGVLLGSEVTRMGEDALLNVVESTTIFARVSPEEKNAIIRALRRRGHVVGYLGDGINDAPSLHTADVGISVDTAVDVARDAADLILTEKSLAVLHEGVLEGRRSFGNILKYLLMVTSSNFGNVLSMAVAAFILPFLPLLPPQVLVNNFLYDLSQVAIPGDRVDESFLRRPRRWQVRTIRRFMLVMGPVSSLFDFLTFAVLLLAFNTPAATFRTGWFLESLATQTLVVFVIRTAHNPLRSLPSPPLALMVLGVVGIALVLTATRAGDWLGFTPLPAPILAFVAAATLAYLLLAQVVKHRFFHRDLA